MKTILSFVVAAFAGLSLFIPNYAFAGNLNFPSDCPNSAQECANQICAEGGGTLYVEAGEHQLGPASLAGLPPFNNNLFAQCSNFKIKGRPGASIDATDSANPIGAPTIAMGALPFEAVRYENVEVSHLTFRCGENCAFVPVGLLGVDGGRLHHLKTMGFTQGLNAVTSNSIKMDHNIIYGRGAGTFSFGINYSASGFPPFLPAGDPNLTLTSGQEISNNLIFDTSVAVNLETVLDSDIRNNIMQRGEVGVRVRGGDDLLVKGNIIRDLSNSFNGGFFTAGLTLSSVDNSQIVNNLILDTTGGPAIMMVNSNLGFEIARNPDVFSNGNADNNVRINAFLGYDPDVCGPTVQTGISQKGYCFTPDGDDGAISDGGGNKFLLNLASPH